MSLKVWLKDINDINNGITNSDYISNGVMTNINEAKEIFNNEKGFSICLSIYNNTTSSTATCNNIITGSTSIFSISNAPNYGSITVSIGDTAVCTINQCIPINERHNLIVIFDVVDSKVRAYVDGILKAESDLSSIPTIASSVAILNDIDYLDIEDYKIYDMPISKKMINEESRMVLCHCPFNDSAYQGTVNMVGDIVATYSEVTDNIATVEKTTLFGRSCLKITKPKGVAGSAGIYKDLEEYVGKVAGLSLMYSVEYYIPNTLTQSFKITCDELDESGTVIASKQAANITQKVSGITTVNVSWKAAASANKHSIKLEFYNSASTSEDVIYIFTAQLEESIFLPTLYTEGIREADFSDVSIYENNGTVPTGLQTPMYYKYDTDPYSYYFSNSRCLKFDVTTKLTSGTLFIKVKDYNGSIVSGNIVSVGDIIFINSGGYITIGDYESGTIDLTSKLPKSIAICWTKGSNSNIYVDGELFETGPVIDSSTLDPSCIYIGDSTAKSTSIFGVFDLRLYGRELSKDEVRDITMTSVSISNKNEVFVRELTENTSQVSIIDDYENITISDGTYSDKAHFTINETSIGTIGSITTTSDGIVRLLIPDGNLITGEKYVACITTSEPDCITDMNTLCAATMSDKACISTVALGVATVTNITSLYVDCTVAPNKTIVFDTLHIFKYNDLSKLSIKLIDSTLGSIIIEDKYMTNTKLNKNNALISKEIIEY